MTPLDLVYLILAAYERPRIERWLHHSSVRLGREPITMLFGGESDAVIVEARAIAAGTVALDHHDVLAVIEP